MEEKHSTGVEEQVVDDETFGVRVPAIKVGISVLVVILSGMFPAILIIVLYASLIQGLPAGLVSSIAIIMSLPVLFWAVYFIYVLVAVLVTRLFLAYYHAKSDPYAKSLNRQFKDKSHPDYKRVHYYHMRGAVIKFSVWITQKCPFPVVNQWVMNFYGTNKIGKRVLYEICGVGMEFCSIGNDIVVEMGSAISSHVVDSLYGNIILAPVEIKDGAAIGTNTPIGPGTILKENYHVGDNCMTFVKWPLKLKEGKKGMFFNGCPSQHCDLRDLIADDRLKDEILKHQEI